MHLIPRKKKFCFSFRKYFQLDFQFSPLEGIIPISFIAIKFLPNIQRGSEYLQGVQQGSEFATFRKCDYFGLRLETGAQNVHTIVCFSLP